MVAGIVESMIEIDAKVNQNMVDNYKNWAILETERRWRLPEKGKLK